MGAADRSVTAVEMNHQNEDTILRCAAFPSTVVAGRGLLPRISSFTGREEYPFIVADEITGPLFGDFSVEWKGFFTLPKGEEGKSLLQVAAIYSALAECGIDRSGTILALGGGVVGDTSGFAAATWMRGIRLIQCPTTLLAQVDSAMGGKTGVNLPEGKNLVGAFHPAEWIFSDVGCLRSQKDEDFRQGLAEAVKYGVGEDWNFFSWLEEHTGPILRRDCAILQHLVEECARMKLAVAAEDERENSGTRARLNLGHTVGHALEAASEYHRWKHGDGVAAGIMVAARLARRLGEFDGASLARLERLLQAFDLPTGPDRPWEDIAPFLARDKKFSDGAPRLVIPRKDVPCVLRDDIPLSLLQDAYEEMI